MTTSTADIIVKYFASAGDTATYDAMCRSDALVNRPQHAEVSRWLLSITTESRQIWRVALTFAEICLRRLVRFYKRHACAQSPEPDFQGWPHFFLHVCCSLVRTAAHKIWFVPRQFWSRAHKQEVRMERPSLFPNHASGR